MYPYELAALARTSCAPATTPPSPEIYEAFPETAFTPERNVRILRFFQRRSRGLKGHRSAAWHDLLALWVRQKGRCALTGRPLSVTERHGAHLDHIVPKARGGHDTLSNLQWVCADANLAKGKLRQHELVQLAADIVRHDRAPLLDHGGDAWMLGLEAVA